MKSGEVRVSFVDGVCDVSVVGDYSEVSKLLLQGALALLDSVCEVDPELAAEVGLGDEASCGGERRTSGAGRTDGRSRPAARTAPPTVDRLRPLPAHGERLPRSARRRHG